MHRRSFSTTSAAIAAVALVAGAIFGPGAAQAQDFRAEGIAALAAMHPGTAIGAALIRDGKVIWSASVGTQDATTAADADTLFNVASLAKPVTAELILRLVEAGSVELDRPMAETWVEPDVSDDPRHRLLTPRVALSHQTGFPNWRPRNRRLAFDRDPGTAFTYSGEGYDYLAHFVEHRTGEDFEALMQARVFDPIALRRTAFTWRPWMEGHVAAPADTDGSSGGSGPGMPGRWSAADDLYVTPADYGAFVAAAARGDGLSPDLAEERLRPQVVTEACPTPVAGCPEAVGMGLGWMIFTFADGRIAMHQGSDQGAEAMAYFDPASHDGAVVMISGEGGTSLVLRVMEVIDPGSRVLAAFRAAGVR